MEKVKVSKEVFEALERFKLRKGEDFKLHLNYCVITGILMEDESVLYSQVNISELVDIAYCGYELEMTKEEILLEIYSNNDNHYAYGAGIVKCLNVLGIEIKGINS